MYLCVIIQFIGSKLKFTKMIKVKAFNFYHLLENQKKIATGKVIIN